MCSEDKCTNLCTYHFALLIALSAAIPDRENPCIGRAQLVSRECIHTCTKQPGRNTGPSEMHNLNIQCNALLVLHYLIILSNLGRLFHCYGNQHVHPLPRETYEITLELSVSDGPYRLRQSQ